jgi:high-affinity iron transporter
MLIYRMGYRLDFRVFFRVMGILLIFFAAGLLGDAVQNMQALGWLPFGGHTLWNTAGILSEDTTIGDLLHTMLGYSEAPTMLQSAFYAGYLAVFGFVFWRLTRRPNGVARPSVSSPTAHATTLSK